MHSSEQLAHPLRLSMQLQPAGRWQSLNIGEWLPLSFLPRVAAAWGHDARGCPREVLMEDRV